MENKKCHENEGYCFLKGTKCPYTEPNAGVSDPTDGRTIYQWESKYPEDAKQEIRLEAMFLFIILFVSLILLFLTWEGWIYLWLPLPPDKVDTLRDYTYYALSGMLGGIIFGMKYFYRVVARGWWHQDRRYWRIMSPFIAMVIAVIIGVYD